MEDLLFLAHRIPYPPNKGDKIRSFNMLKYLAGRYRVHLGAFIDNPVDWRYVNDLERFCVNTCFRRIDPFTARLRSLKGFLSGEPLTLPYCYDRHMRQWVNNVLAGTPTTRVFVFSSGMAQYVRTPGVGGVRRLIDFADVDSDKWRQYSERKHWPISWIYRREASKLLEYERAVAAEYDASLFVSAEECELFRRLAPEVQGHVVSVENGVDVEYFFPEAVAENPYAETERVLVFVGAMDYWANIDAVRWFAKHVFPDIHELVPESRFYIVGSNPAEAVRRLSRQAGVTVTGPVRDIRPYLAHACMSVAPLRIARGIQNKVLEAMAMDKPVLATTPAAVGLDPESKNRLLIADEPQELVKLAVDRLTCPDTGGAGYRQHICRRYSWGKNLEKLIHLFENATTGQDEQPDSQTIDVRDGLVMR
jgi:sugar transferase (PEP-CTERM/EpsH1 system associated)